MLHKISIENFFSVAERQEVAFEVPKNAPDLDCFRVSVPDSDKRLPLIVGVYGPNASGKSTILRGITATSWFVQQSFGFEPTGSIPLFTPYACKEWEDKPSKILIEYDGRLMENEAPSLFRYELHIGHQADKSGNEVRYEALSYAPKGKFRRIFERELQQFTFGREFGIGLTDSRIQSIRSNASVVSTLAQLNHKISSNFLLSLRSLQTNIVGMEKGIPGFSLVLAYYAHVIHYFFSD